MKNKRFTMIELMAVITIASFLLIMTINSFKHKPVTSVQLQIGGAIQSAFNKHLADKIESRVYVEDGKLITLHDVINLNQVNVVITMAGETVTEFTFDKFEVRDSQGYVLIKISDVDNQDNFVVVRISGFTGHVSYYE